MAALEKVMQLKREGRTDPEIISALKAQGVPPMQISDALNQSKIKEAIVDPNPTEGMTASIMGSENDPVPSQDNLQREAPPADLYDPTPTQAPQPPQSMAPQTFSQPMSGQEQYYDQYAGQQQDPFSAYGQETYAEQPMYDEYSAGGYDDGYGSSTDTMIEVAEQVFSEKIKRLTKEIRELTHFKSIFETKVENLSNRLERMEKHFDKMQLDVLGKVSEYGKGLDYIKKELSMVEDSMGKFNQQR